MTQAARKRMPDTRRSVTKKISIRPSKSDGDAEALDIYITVGLYEDGTPGELFMKAGKTGGTVSGLLDAVSVCISLGLQYGVPLRAFVEKLKGTQFEPDGPTDDLDIRRARSMLDAAARWIALRFLTEKA